ncbi:MAG: hypothetical protein ABSB89_05000 [Candidatus Bathyarchaeia archaeon]
MSQTKGLNTFEKFLLVVVIVGYASIFIPTPFVFGNWTILELICVVILAVAAPYEYYKFFKRRIEQRRQAKEAKNLI